MVNMMLKAFHVGSDVKNSISSRLGKIINQPELLESYQTVLTKSQIRALVEVIAGCGLEHIQKAGEKLLVLWNRSGDKAFRYQYRLEMSMHGSFYSFSLEKSVLGLRL
jgi:hypothetical protein